jgi:hypothetical protein
MSAQSSCPRAGQARPADSPGAAEPTGPGARQRRPAAKGLRLAQAACGVGWGYAAVGVYWALGGTWLLDTVGGTLEQQGRTGNPGTTTDISWTAPTPGIAFEGERLEVFPGGLLAGGRRTMSSTGAARWRA